MTAGRRPAQPLEACEAPRCRACESGVKDWVGGKAKLAEHGVTAAPDPLG